jgi:hypothetical protein
VRVVSVQKIATVALLCALAFSVALPASPALAASIKTRTIAQAVAQDQLLRTQADLEAKVANYISICRELERTRTDVSEVTTRLADATSTLQEARSSLASRAVEMYRTPPVGLLEAFFTATSIQGLLQRLDYLAIVTERDAYRLKEARLAATEEAWLQQSLTLRVAQLEKLQAQADAEQIKLVAEVKVEEARAAAAGTSYSPVADTGASGPLPTGGDPSGKFVKETVVSEANFRNPTSMSAAQIQAFLDSQPGALKNTRVKNHYGVTKSAAEIIADASTEFNVSPKIILATLQKEQSLLSTKNPSQRQFNGAMGAGMPDSGSVAGNMQGLGNQIWWGAQKLDKNAKDWHSGIFEPVDGTKVYASNPGTFAQYRYTPHFSGVMSFWTIYWRYFGNPLG